MVLPALPVDARSATGSEKIAASKARGIWMGGTPPLGDQPDGGPFAIATRMQLSCAISTDAISTRAMSGWSPSPDREGILSPVRAREKGATFGGCRFIRVQIDAILSNPISIGEIRVESMPNLQRSCGNSTSRQPAIPQ